MESYRILAGGVFAVSLFMLWTSWTQQHQPPSVASGPATSIEASSIQKTSDLTMPTIPKSPLTPGESLKPNGPAVSQAPVSIKTDLFEVDISPMGGDFVRLALQKQIAADNKGPLILFQKNDGRTYIFQSGLLGHAKTGDVPNHKSLFTLSSSATTLTEGQNRLEVVFESSTSAGRLVKTYVFERGSYQIEINQKFFPAEDIDASSVLAYYQLVRDSRPPEGESKMISAYTGPAVYTQEGKFQKVTFDHITKDKLDYVKRATNGWVAMLQHYFVAAIFPDEGVQREFYTQQSGPGLFSAGVILPTQIAVDGGKIFESHTRLFAGPEEQSLLKKTAPGFNLVVDYGWLTILAAPLFFVLQFCHSLVGNWGWAIVMLTLIIKIMFYPLSAYSYRSMAKLKNVTPQMMRLREKYGSDKLKMQQEMMALYKKEKVNPLGGCLPILIQIPVFIALYWVLLGAVEMRHAPWILWIKDLSAIDPIFILPLIMGVTMWVQSRMSPPPPDPVQAKVMKIMPLVFSIMFFFFPAGLVLYWVVNNIFSILQQWWITRSLATSKT